MKNFLACLLLILGFAYTACAAAPTALAGTWQLTSYGSATNPKPAAPTGEASITFNADGKVSGNMGCNRFGGEYKANASQITFGMMMSTMMACIDNGRMEQESETLSILTQTVSYKIDGATLTIIGANGDRVVLVKK